MTGPKRILVIEDNREMQHMMEYLLRGPDREVTIAGTGNDGEQALADTDFDLVVLDLILPDIDGRAILSRMRHDPRTSTVPVVVVSAQTEKDIRQECFDLGADAYLAKPFDPDALASDVSARLARGGDRERTAFEDPLTGLLDQAGLNGIMTDTVPPYTLLLAQLDGFASLVDRWGWSDAEKVLLESARVIDGVAADAKVARIAGGEFAAVAAGDELTQAEEFGEAMLEALRAMPMKDPSGEVYTMTASIGVLVVEDASQPDEAMEAARRRLYQAREAGGNRVASSDGEDEGKTPRILVAEDDEISATLLLHRLEKDGVEIDLYDNGRDAYEAAVGSTPDLVILDVKMPGMEGFEVLEKLRGMHAYSRIPIILVTSMGSEADVVRGFQLGADDYILKPFSPVELSARVWRLLRNGRSASAV